jgi:hypothetical protein
VRHVQKLLLIPDSGPVPCRMCILFELLSALSGSYLHISAERRERGWIESLKADSPRCAVFYG